MEGTIYIHGEIGVDVTLTDVVAQVKALEGLTSLVVRIDSVGGYVDSGFDIYNYLVSLKIPIKTVGSGVVASIATVIFMAGTQRVLSDNCTFMIHLPWGTVAGTAEEVSNYSDELAKAEKRIIDFYKKTTGLGEEAIRPMLKDETFLSGEQAVSLGFATAVEAATVKAKLSITKNPRKMSDKSILSKLGDFIKGLAGEIKDMLQVTAADGSTVIEFADLAPDAVPAVGDIATVDGQPATGEHLMPTGETYVFNTDGSGALAEIRAASEEDDDELEQENARLKQELAETKKELEAMAKWRKKMESEAKALFASVKSELKDDKGTPPKKVEEPAARRLLKK